MRQGMSYNRTRRLTLVLIGLLGSYIANSHALAHHTDTHFEESSTHRIIYQLNKADPVYLQSVLFSVGELLRKYGDDVEIIIAVIGPGLHLIGKHPERPIPAELQQRASSLAEYGVAFHACGNTMKSLGWTEKDLFKFARIVPIGVDDIMLLQEKGYTYFSW